MPSIVEGTSYIQCCKAALQSQLFVVAKKFFIAVDLPSVNPYCWRWMCALRSRKQLSLPTNNFSGMANRLIPRQPATEWTFVLSDLGTTTIFACFHLVGKHPSRRHLLKSDSNNVGWILWSHVTMVQTIPSGPGLLFSFIWLITSSILCLENSGSG